MKEQMDYSHEMTVGDMKKFLEGLDDDLVIYNSVFKPMQGLIQKKPVKFGNLKVGRGCVYVNSYLEK